MKINKWGNNKGFTLIELLTIVVILGIISGIAIPVIFNIIENNKKDALLSSAINVAEAARLYDIGESPVYGIAWESLNAYISEKITLSMLMDKGYMDVAISPENRRPFHESSYVYIYRFKDGRKVYQVQLIRTRDDGTRGYLYFLTDKIDVYEYTRDDVVLNESQFANSP